MRYWGVIARDWLERHSRWNQLKALGSSNLVRASVLMPAFGYMLLLNQQAHQYLTIKYDGWLLNYLPNVWRIWLLFYGSFFLAAATILYSAFCPQEVKRYMSAFEMADAEAKHQYNLSQSSLVQHEVRKIYLEMAPWMVSYFDMEGMNHEADVSTFANPEAHLSKYLRSAMDNPKYGTQRAPDFLISPVCGWPFTYRNPGRLYLSAGDMDSL